MFDIMTMAENIKTYRNKRGMNQYEFAEKLGISPQSVIRQAGSRTLCSDEVQRTSLITKDKEV